MERSNVELRIPARCQSIPIIQFKRKGDDACRGFIDLCLSRIDTDDNDHESVDDLATASSRPLLPVTPLIDNPDQRIAQDADSLCRTLSGIIPLLLISPFTIAYYTYRTWQITGYYGPLGILVYFLVWTCLNKIFISAVSRTIFRQNILEGNFRFLHTQVRTYHETIAFYHGGFIRAQKIQ